MASHIALLYSIVLGPGRRVTMARLRSMAAEIGFAAPRTLVSTGNLIFDSGEADAAAIERRLEAGFATTFGRHVDIIVRDAASWRRLVAGCPFADAPPEEAPRIMARVMRTKLPASTLERLAPYIDDEEVRIVDGDLWVRFPRRASTTRLLAALTTRRLGVGTARNWNTVCRLGAMLDAP